MNLTSETIAYLLGLAGLVTIIFSIYNSFRNPQIKADKDGVVMREDFETLNREVSEIKEKHLASVEVNIKDLSSGVHELALQVTRLSTIIDERMPKKY